MSTIPKNARKHLSASDEFYNEKGERGTADAFWFVEDGEYSVVMLAEKRWRTPKGREYHCRAQATYKAATPAALAWRLHEEGWEPPENVKDLCETRGHATRRRRKA